MEPGFETQRISELFERQYELLAALHVLAQQQSECIGVDDVEVLLSLLARKQPLLEELLALQAELKIFREQDPDQRVWRSPSERQKCLETQCKCSQMHREIVQLESATLSAIESHRNAIAAQLQDGRDASLANTAYSTDSLLEESTFDLTNS